MDILQLVILLFLPGCLAFSSGGTGFKHTATHPRERGAITISQKRPLRMMPFDADGAGVVEAMNHANYILAVAADATRGGPVVDQIEYVPGDVADFDKIVLGSAACVGAYAWAAYEFGSVSDKMKGS